MKSLLYIFGVLALLTACVHDPFPPTPETVCDQGGVDFTNEIQPLLTAKCGMSGCHGNGSAQDGFSVESYSAIMEEVEGYELNEGDLWERINENSANKVMPKPPYAPLTTDEKDLIRRWIMEGALETDCGRISCQYVAVPSYQTDIAPLSELQCNSCHSGSSPIGGFTLTSKADWEFALDNFGLIDALHGQNGRKLMPDNANAPLDTCYIHMVELWDSTGRGN